MMMIMLMMVMMMMMMIMMINDDDDCYDGDSHITNFLSFLRKKTLMANNIIAIVGGIFLFITKATHSIYVLIIGRFLVGINAGKYFLLTFMIHWLSFFSLCVCLNLHSIFLIDYLAHLLYNKSTENIILTFVIETMLHCNLYVFKSLIFIVKFL